MPECDICGKEVEVVDCTCPDMTICGAVLCFECWDKVKKPGEEVEKGVD